MEASLKGTDRLANMFSYGICIMSMVHCQGVVLLQFPVVIYLAAFPECSCCWHWLTNQMSKPHPENQRKLDFKIFVCDQLLDFIPNKSTSFFFLVCKSQIFFFIQSKNIKLLWLRAEYTAFCFCLLQIVSSLTLFLLTCIKNLVYS